MASVPWYRLWRGFPTHRKTLHLCELLADHNAGMYLVRLFDHCAEMALDGRVHKAVVEGAAGWRAKRGKFIAAASDAGLLSKDGDFYIVHGWEERNGAVIRKALTDAKKPRGNLPSHVRPPAVPRGTPGGHERVPRGKRAGSPGGPGGVDQRSETEATRCSQSVASETTEPAEQPNGLGPTDPSPDWFWEFRQKLGARTHGEGPMGIGNDPETVAVFEDFLGAIGEEELLDECVRLTAYSDSGPVRNLSWFVHWLKTVPRSKLEHMRATREGRHVS
jgi:hypothetical protein